MSILDRFFRKQSDSEGYDYERIVAQSVEELNLNTARSEEVVVKRRGGETFSMIIRKSKKSPFDVPGVNDHLRSRWLEFSTIGRKTKRTSVLLSLNLLPGA